jgi:hypothetical protein
MVKEVVSIAWKDMSIYIVPELPTSVDDIIKRHIPSWEISRFDDATKISNPKSKAYIISDSKETRAMCMGEYGKNFKNLKDIGVAIKKVAEVSKRTDIQDKLSKNICSTAIVCEALPIGIAPVNNLEYKTRGNRTEVRYLSTFYQFLNDFYRHIYSKTFSFQ